MQNIMQNNNDKNIASKPIPYRIILIVDDEPDITSSLKMGLEYNGFEVQTFNDPVEALSNFTAYYIQEKKNQRNSYSFYCCHPCYLFISSITS